MTTASTPGARLATSMAAKISGKLLAAKAAAVDRFLGTGKEFTGLTALAASTKPEHNVVARWRINHAIIKV